jgi:glycosyltransferase involved in cell wall biosynthesis
VTRPIRVLWVIKGLGPGGAERLLVSLAEASDPVDVTYEAVYLLPWKDQLVPALTKAGVTVQCLDGARGWDLRWVFRLRRLIRHGSFDVVHGHSPAVAPFVRLAVRTMRRSRRPRLAYTEHNTWRSYSPATRWLNAATFGLDDVQFAVADAVRESIPPRRRARVHTVIHGIDVARIGSRRAEREASRAELGVGPDEIVVGTVANFRFDKDYPNLLRAAAVVVRDHANVRFMAAGQGPLDREIRQLRAELGLGERFRLLGYVEDAVRFLAACDVFVLASRNEGLPVAVMEASALGLPIVATAVGGVPSAVGGVGRLVPAESPAELAAAISRLVSSPDERTQLSEASLERASTFDSAKPEQTIREAYLRP